MSRNVRQSYYSSDRDRDRDRDRIHDHDRDRDRNWDRSSYRSDRRSAASRKRTRSRSRDRTEKRRSRSPRKTDKDVIDENILSEIAKLPEPSELWENNQFPDGFSAPPPPPAFTQENPPPTFTSNYQPSYSGIYDDFPSLAPVPTTAPHQPDISAWNQMSLPPPPAPPTYNIEDKIKKEAAIESEMRHQKAALSKQREDYIKKANVLKKELDTLKDQRNELRGDAKRSPSPDTKRFLKENTKLQLEIQNKLKTINNVVDMLNGIIGEEAQEIPDTNDTERVKRKSRSPSKDKFNYVYYDPEMHWCRVCNEFPSTAKDYLNHLHSPAHHKMAAAHMEAPWHSVTGVNEGFPSVTSAPTKRTPIRGLQFFVPSTAWYCKLCDQFIGDLHCASAHLKSIVHSKNYTNFVEQNPHWETDWMSDRQKAFEKSRANKNKAGVKLPYTSHTITFNKDGFHTVSKESTPPPPVEKKKEKKKKTKKKKSNSSSSSGSESSSSDSDTSKKKKKAKSKKDKKAAVDDKTLTEWMSSIQVDKLNESDRKLLDSFKTRLKNDKYLELRDRREEKERREESRRSMERAREKERERRQIEELQRKLRKTEESRRREERTSTSIERDSRSVSKSRTPSRTDPKKPEIKKMPFIGKMPVFKNLNKNVKIEEPKKDEQKKREQEENDKKKQEEIDAEIQKKVSEFKEKIALAQLDRPQQVDLPPPGLALPTPAQFLQHQLPLPTPTSAPAPPPPPPPPTQPTLPKDFQEALDIIFPTDPNKNPELQNDGIFGIAPGFPVPGLPGVMQPFSALGLMNPQMFGFDLNAQLFQPRPQLYDTHVPLVPNQNKPKPQHVPLIPNQNKPRPQMKKNRYTKAEQKRQHKRMQNVQIEPNNFLLKKEPPTSNSSVTKQERMDDLAMLGIDASDVGAGY